MRLAFDAKRVYHNFTGLGNYSRTLLRDLSNRLPESAFYLLAPSIKMREETKYFLNSPSYSTITPPPWRKPLWRSRGMLLDLKRIKPDLYHGLSHELPHGLSRSRIATVVTIHDLIFRHYPHQYKAWDRRVYDRKFRHACKTADRIVAISEATKADIVEFYQTDPARIDVIYQACDERFLIDHDAASLENVRQQLELPQQFSLFLGSLIERKNLLGLIEALAILPSELRHPLVVVGRGEAYKNSCIARAKELGVADLLLFRQASNQDLPSLYQLAYCFLYPSLAEGFGIPVIEALNSGTPVITSDRSSLPEAAGPDSLLVDPTDPSAIAAAWQRLLEDSDLHQRTSAAGRRYAERFRADEVTPQMIDLYRKVAG